MAPLCQGGLWAVGGGVDLLGQGPGQAARFSGLDVQGSAFGSPLSPALVLGLTPLLLPV